MKQLAWLTVGLLASSSALAWDCKFEKNIDETLDLSGSQLLTIKAGAGDLVVRGDSGTNQARIIGKACASSEEWLDGIELLTEGGEQAEIAVSLPETNSSWSWTGNRYVYLDLEILVPDDLALEINDSSGDLSAMEVASVSIRDSSGDIRVEDVTGDVVLEDSSGDIELADINGDVTVNHDSSGDIYGEDIEGNVLVAKDSSGDIRFKRVRDDFVVERDSSGDIVADTVGGDFRVLKDGSGSVRSKNVSGEIEIPDKG